MTSIPVVSTPPQAGEPPAANQGGETAPASQAGAVAPVRARRPRAPAPATGGGRRRVRARRVGVLLSPLAVLGLIGSAAYLALQSVYFVGTNSRGLVTLFRGVPYRLPGNLALYSSDYVSGVSAATLPPARRKTVLDHSLRSEGDAASLIRSLELGELE
jgi:protein phosphatase